MAAGRAVIASEVGGLIDIVKDGLTGMLVPPNNPIALAETLDAVIDDTKRLEEMGRAGRMRLKQFSTTTIGPLIEEAYESAIRAWQTGG
jgi:starch synthase